MKRIMCLLLALVMVFSLVGVSAFAADDETDAEETASEETADPAAESEEEDSSEEPATEEPVEDEADAEETEEVEESNAGIMLMSSGSSGTVTVPVTVTGDSDGIYSWSDYSEITVGRSYSIQIKAGYDIEVTGAAVTSRSNYRLDSDGNVYRSCSFTVSEEDYVEGLTVTVEIVTSSEETPTAVKITEILPEGATENDVYYGSSPDAYVLSNGYGSFRLRKGYTVTATGADLLYAGENTYSTTYYIYPQDGAEEITLTFTKLDGGTLAVTGESSQLVEITDGSDTIETGSFVENDGILYITVNEGYVVTGGTTYGRHSTTDGIQTIYTVAVADILTDGVATVNVEQGVIVKVVSEDETGAEYAAGIDGYTYAVGELIYTYGNFNYIAEFSGAGVSVTDTIYDCIETTGAVCPRYTLTTSSAGTLTISIRQAKDGELPTAIKVEYIDEDNALVKGTSYVLPGNSLSVLTKTDYTVEVKGATPYSISIGDIYYNGSEYVSEWYGSVDEDATAVTVTVVPVVDSAKLKIVDESGADASAAAIQVEDIDSVVAGDTLDAGRNYLCLANGYEIANVEGATYYELGYDIADDGTIYVRYALVPTGDPSTVQVTVVEKAILATVTIVNNGIHAYVDNYKEKISNTEYTVLSADEF
ncbi:MAG: hypothetical protein LUH42_00850, partial [Oscillospiraceae bacterium]|nr:hypothetical protein [Oscillospiraceae bacterium]